MKEVIKINEYYIAIVPNKGLKMNTLKALYYKLFRPDYYGALLELARLKAEYDKDKKNHKNSKRSWARYSEQRAIVELIK